MHGKGVNITPNAMQHHDSYVVNFWRENKNSANWCAQQSKENPSITADLILLTLYFLLTVTGILLKSAL